MSEAREEDGSGRTRIRVRIAGEEHAIRSAADPEHTRRCAALVDERIREVQERSGLLENHRAAILAALSIADEYVRAADQLQGARSEAMERADALVRRVEAGLTGRTPPSQGPDSVATSDEDPATPADSQGGGDPGIPPESPPGEPPG